MKLETKPEDHWEDMDLEDELADIAADLVEFEENSLFLSRLFAAAVGQWLEVISLCDGLERVANQLTELNDLCEGTLKVTWLEHPISGSGYSLILFYMEELHWNSLALYNKQLFLQKSTQQTLSIV